ncbi:protein-ER retention protein-like protein [Amylocarpus encephaloides]|uniref:Protein-ER retention protein-like protein n=1 Tax=Amylocarpus encephaloides TaxID=45428 RepID=A0A9P7YL53_9HELO|nr:protein-ER retention protein-like protein [Amylocarpus encephaloides]
MDGDPAVESELDSFSLTLPLPYRIAIAIVLGVWAWGVNLHYLSLAKIDVPSLIQYPGRPSPRTDPSHHLSTYRLATLLSIPLGLSLLIFWAFSHRKPELVIYYDFLPISYLFLLLGLFLLPIRQFSSAGRTRFLTTLRRVSIGGIAQTGKGKFGDILLADVLTSYAKIIADLFVALCMFFSSNGSATKRPDRGCGGQYIVPIVIAIPSMIRFRQCMIEYLRVRDSNRRNGGIGAHGWGGQHLANALKYATAFPVIIFSALQRNLSLDHEDIGVTETTLYRLWLVAVFTNSFYSFYWDVAKDWDLTLFSAQRSSPSHPFGLRPRLFFPAKEFYYFAIGTDLMLRCTWSLKLSPHLDHFADFESGIFLLEFLEVARRWMWVFFRVETEWGRGFNAAILGAPGQDDVLLGDYESEPGDSD